MTGSSLLAGPDPRAGAEGLQHHLGRVGPLPAAGPDLIGVIERSGLLGRGGASFPVGTKWRAVASSPGPAVVLANGSEGEPLSRKDQVLMCARPHLVLDGAFLAADAVGADRVVIYLGEDHPEAAAAMTRALQERPADRRRAEIVLAPAGYVTGEESAAVNFVNTGASLPIAVPPRPFERGVDGRPTLVQNVESLAHAALIARRGDEWFRSLGHGSAAGTVLLTIGGAVRYPGVVEVAAGLPVGDVLGLAGGTDGGARAVLLGGYFGSWVEAGEANDLRVDASGLRAAGRSLGCGVLWVLPETASPVAETARVVRYLAGESASQCGPCFFGLRALADACERIAAGSSHGQDLERLRRWSAEVAGRGACRHPDGAVGFLRSALQVFDDEFEAACGRTRAGALRA
jgi:NADH:ubiquinone oxidoreductase subunit F (NADH-binding)